MAKVAEKNKVDVYQMITDRIIAILESGTAPWRKPWAGGREPANLISKKTYRGINYFLLACSAYESPYWITYKQAQDLGGNVRKGEKGTPVVFWKILEKNEAGTETENSIDKKNGIPFLRYYTVFNVEQCDGVKIPEGIEPDFVHDPIETAEAIYTGMPNRPVVNITRSGRAFYMPSTDTITVPELAQYKQAQEFYGTLFHELAHATGHQSRLNREGVTGHNFFGDREYSKEELVAEMTASFLCGHAGIENATINNSAAYLQGWIKQLRGDKKLAITAAGQAIKAADYILGKANTEAA